MTTTIIPVSMTSDSRNHAKEVADRVVIGTTPDIKIRDDVQHLVDALHDLLAGAKFLDDVVKGDVRTITIDVKSVTANDKRQLDEMLEKCLTSINEAEQTAPGLILKV